MTGNLAVQGKKFRELLRRPGIIIAPGAFDAWSARLVENAGFSIVYMTGYGVSASVLGQPDIGLMTMSEMAGQAGNIASAVTIPFIADGDTGYGGILNVIRTVREFEKAGVAGIQLEDQVFPKRCGHMEGKQVIPMEEMAAKIRAAVYARRSDDFVIIARTDARDVTDLDDAIARALAYAEAGADILFVEAPRTIEEMKKVTGTIKMPLIANMVEKGKTPALNARELEQIGYKIVIYPVTTLYAATMAMTRVLDRLRKDGTSEHCLENLTCFEEFNKLIGVREARELEKKFL